MREKKLHSKVVNKRKRKTAKPSASEEPKKSEGRLKEVKYRREISHESKRSSPQTASKEGPSTVNAEPQQSPNPIYENLPVVPKTEDAPKLSTGKIISSRLKRSNRISTEITSDGAKKLKEDLTAKKEPKPMTKKVASKANSPVKRKKRKKEIADAMIDDKKVDLPAEDPVGKVHNWLLQSISGGRDNFGIMTLTLPKSKSSPVGFAAASKPVQTPRVHKTDRVVQIPKLSQHRSRSAGNLRKEGKKDEKVKLQVVYRPPFKLSLKLRNSAGSVRTRVAPDRPNAQTSRTTRPTRAAVLVPAPVDDIDSNVHTVPSDLDVLLSESEFLFSDAWRCLIFYCRNLPYLEFSAGWLKCSC